MLVVALAHVDDSKRPAPERDRVARSPERRAGYALSQRVNASGLSYIRVIAKKPDVEHRDNVVSFKAVEDAIKRLRQDEKLPWEFVSDGSAVSHPVSEDIRIWNRYVGEGRQRTLMLGVGDLDKAGVQNVMRPHVEHVGAFLLGLAERHSDMNEGGRRVAVKAMFDFKRVAVTPEPAMELELPGLDVDALAANGASGTDDWTRDLSLLTEKVEVEAVGPQRLREAVVTAIEDALDLDALEQGRRDEQAQQERVGKMRDRLAELGDEELS